ncbi:hypothetical protein [Kribbella sp. NPDC004536]
MPDGLAASPAGSPDPIDHLAEFDRTAADLAAVLGDLDPSRPVPAAPA